MSYELNDEFQKDFFQELGIISFECAQEVKVLKASCIDTPLGAMIAIVDEQFLYFLDFTNRSGLGRKITQLKIRTQSVIIPGSTIITFSVIKELGWYFDGKLKSFTTPVCFFGSDFQKRAWAALSNIPYGETRSYLDQSKVIQNPSAFRAVANANGANQIAIVIPCHRIIKSTGGLGGYGGGVTRKKWLIEHEKSYSAINVY